MLKRHHQGMGCHMRHRLETHAFHHRSNKIAGCSEKHRQKAGNNTAKQEEQKQSEYIGIDDDDMAAFANLRQSVSEKPTAEPEVDPMDLFL